MACYTPIPGWFAKNPNPETGKRSVVFTPNESNGESVNVPCGKCIGCRSDQALMWSIRAYHESTLHDRNCFLTLTYDDDHLPENGELVKEDLQKFFKRLRHKYKFRYFACGEYGEQTHRPHYHAIIFGQHFDEYGYKSDLGNGCYTNSHLESIWGHGNIMIAECNLNTVMYTCGYVHKKVGDPDTFTLISRRPPIGSGWLEAHKENISRLGKVIIDGKELPVPNRYLEWEDYFLKHVKKSRIEYAKAEALKPKHFLERDSKIKNRLANLKNRQKGETL